MADYVSGPTIKKFKKNWIEEVRASVDQCDDYDLMNFRVHKWIKRCGWIATEKGLSLRVGQFTDFLEMVLTMGTHLKNGGLLSAAQCSAVERLLDQFRGSWGVPPNQPPPDPPPRRPLPRRRVMDA